MIKLIPREEYLKSLPKKRMWSGVIIKDWEWRILLLKTSYKKTWEIPGWVVDEWESPKKCAEREVREEIWIDITVWELLVVEYHKTDIDDALMFIFDWWTIHEKDITIDDDEIVEYKFVKIENIWTYITHSWLKKRIEYAVNNEKGTVYYDW